MIKYLFATLFLVLNLITIFSFDLSSVYLLCPFIQSLALTSSYLLERRIYSNPMIYFHHKVNSNYTSTNLLLMSVYFISPIPILI